MRVINIVFLVDWKCAVFKTLALSIFSLNVFGAIENTGKSLVVTGGDASEIHEALRIAQDESIPAVLIGPGVWDLNSGGHGGVIIIENWKGAISGQSKADTVLLGSGRSGIFLISGNSDVKLERMMMKAHQSTRRDAAVRTEAPTRCDEQVTIFLEIDRVRVEHTIYEDQNGYEAVGYFGSLVEYGSFHDGASLYSPCRFEDLRQVSGTLTINRSESDAKLAHVFATAGGAKISITDNEVTSEVYPGVEVTEASTELTMLRNRMLDPEADFFRSSDLLHARYLDSRELDDQTGSAARMAAGFNIKGNHGGGVYIRVKDDRPTPVSALIVDNRFKIMTPEGELSSCIQVYGQEVSLTASGNYCDNTSSGILEDIVLGTGTTATINQPNLEVFDYGASSVLIFDKNGVSAY